MLKEGLRALFQMNLSEVTVALEGWISWARRIAASLRMEVNPVQWCRSANDAVLFRSDVKEYRIANYVTLVISPDYLLGFVRWES